MHRLVSITAFALVFTLTACAKVEEAAVTSPLVGAEQIDERGEARVLETLDTGRYTYLKLDGAPEGTWNVVMGSKPREGDLVAWRGYAELYDFRSSSLDRSFPRLVFSSVRHSSNSKHTENSR